MYSLEIKDLKKAYPGGLQALKGVGLQVEKGDFFALLGPNGAGKSTIIGIITGIVNKTSGIVRIFGHDLEKEPILVKSLIGVVPQEINFNQFEKVIDIVVNQAGYYGIPRKLALERASYYLNKLGLWHKRKAVSRSLSGGMKRRLMIARGLVHAPKMLILDEPTAGVDIELRRSTWEFLQEINHQGTTIILTTHNLEEAEYLCNGLAIIDQGIILEHTTVGKLLEKLQYETLILDLVDPIEKLPEIKDYQFRLIDSNNKLEVNICKTKSINNLFKELDKLKIKVSSMRNKANRLEELFIDLIQSK